MRRSSLSSILFVAVIAFATPVFAASIGNPETIGESGKVAVGIEYDNSRQSLHLKDGRVNDGVTGSSFNASSMRLKTQSEYMTVTVGALQNLDVFAGLGTNKARLNLNAEYGDGGYEAFEINDGSNIAWKTGAKGTFADISGVKLGGMVQYSAFKMRDTFKVNGTELDDLFAPVSASYNSKTRVREWQAALTAGTKVAMFSPYAGVTYAKTSVSSDTDIHVASDGVNPAYNVNVSIEAKQAHSFGGVVGTGINDALFKGVNLNMEGRFGNEDALAAAINYQF